MEKPDHSTVIDLALQLGLLRDTDVRHARSQTNSDQSAIDHLIKDGKLTPNMIRSLIEKHKQAGNQDTSPAGTDYSSDTWGQDDPFCTQAPTQMDAALLPKNGNPLLNSMDDLEKTLVEGDSTHHYGFPEEWERYQFRAFLGEGGMGRVYLAFDPKLKRQVAVKFMRGDDPLLNQRFMIEARAQAGVDHERVCKVYEVDQIQDRTYIAMQYIDGCTLKNAAAEMNLDQKITIIQQVAEGLHAAHRAGLIHRDIKPGNVMIEKTAEGRYKSYIMDFGLAKGESAPGLTTTGMIVGTAYYMAPEQARGDHTQMDRRTDVYSLGATLYETLTGEPPFSGASSVEVIVQLLEEEPPSARSKNSSLPTDLNTIVMKCLEKDPARRYESARALAEDLARFQDGDPIQARRASTYYRISKYARKNKPLVAVSAIAAMTVLAVAGWGIQARLEAENRARLARQLDQEVADIENIARYTYLVPMDDIRPKRLELRHRLDSMERTIKKWGDPAVGPGCYAMGRVQLLLGSVDEAHQNLEKSWNSGYHEPKVAYTLGLVLGKLYERALSELDDIRDKNLKQIRRQEIQETYREPALEYLRKGKNVELEAPEYGQALVAFYEGKYDEALELADTAYKQLPWLYEALQLKGRIRTLISHDKITAGQYHAAMLELGRSLNSHEQAGEIAKSDPWVHLGIAQVASKMIQVEEFGLGGDIQPHFQQGLIACERALNVYPECAEAYYHRTELYAKMASHQINHGMDPKENLEQAIYNADHTVKLAPDDPIALIQVGRAYLQKGKFERKNSLDPTKSLSLAQDAYTRAIKIKPTYRAYNASLIINKEIAEYMIKKGQDPEKHWQAAEKAYKQAINIRKNIAGTHNNMGNLLLTKARYYTKKHRPADKAYSEAIDSYKKALSRNPNFFASVLNAGIAHLEQAERLHKSGKNPLTTCKLAISQFKEAQSINPRHPIIQAGIFQSRMIQAEHEYFSGKNPLPTLESAKNACKKAIDISPNSSKSHDNIAKAKILEFTYLSLMRKDPIPVLKSTSSHLSRSLSIDPNNTQSILTIDQVSILESQITQAEIPHKTKARYTKKSTFNTQNTIIDPEIKFKQATIHLLLAIKEIANNKSPANNISLAEQCVPNSLPNSYMQLKSQIITSYANLLTAQWLTLNKKQNSSHLSDAEINLKKALTLYPSHPELASLKDWLSCLSQPIDGDHEHSSALSPSLIAFTKLQKPCISNK